MYWCVNLNDISRLPSLRYLRTFQFAGRHLSFKDAADELAVTASAVSHQIKNLEAFLGVALFDRKTRALEYRPTGSHPRNPTGVTQAHSTAAPYGR